MALLKSGSGFIISCPDEIFRSRLLFFQPKLFFTEDKLQKSCVTTWCTTSVFGFLLLMVVPLYHDKFTNISVAVVKICFLPFFPTHPNFSLRNLKIYKHQTSTRKKKFANFTDLSRDPGFLQRPGGVVFPRKDCVENFGSLGLFRVRRTQSFNGWSWGIIPKKRTKGSVVSIGSNWVVATQSFF